MIRLCFIYVRIPFASGETRTQAVFDTEGDQMLFGAGVKRVHGCLVHVDIIGGKIWIQRDRTKDEIAEEFVRWGDIIVCNCEDSRCRGRKFQVV